MANNQFDICTLAVRAEFNGVEDVVNVFDLQKTDATPADDASVLSDLEDFVNLVYGLVAAFQAITTLYRELKVYNRTQGTVVGAATITSPAAGTNPADQIPAGNAALISFPTNIGKVVGRKYIGALVETTLEADGSLNAPTVTSLLAIANAIRAPFTGTTSNWQYGVVRSIDGSFHVPLASVVTDTMAYQRRRKPGRGS